MDLFDHYAQQGIAQEAPLAARMRPRSLEEFIGQDAILGPGRLLRRAIQADQLSSVIFYGPPGTGKTTLAQIIANTSRAHFIALNAVLAGVKEIRAAIEVAQEQRGFHQQRTILFIDEVHRFNKAQQDALLPWVENGTVILIGATTENPYFEVNKALVSRSRLFQLKPLSPADLDQIARQALADRQRGYGDRPVALEAAALDHLVQVANGDARALLNALELAVETTLPDSTGKIPITLAVAEESIQKRAVLYDKEGDAHFDTISAYIKSLRGSDADAALYWLARMIYAGEDPRFIFRRLLILASEDIGLADPQAVVIVTACAQAFDRVGLPEGHYPLAQATLYCATAPKSNSVLGFFDALKAVEQQQEAEVPNPLKDSSRDQKGFGHGVGYRYPHAYPDHWVAQRYLPAHLQGQVFYQPSDQGQEALIQSAVARRREAQLAALSATEWDPAEVLSCSPTNPAQDRWLQRTLNQAGQKLGAIRDHLFTLAQVQRHHLILDLNAADGLLVWEALRQAPEGGVYACVRTQAQQNALQDQAQSLDHLSRPVILLSPLTQLQEVLHQQASDLRFDRIVGYNALLQETDKLGLLRGLPDLLLPQGHLVLAESIPRRTQRLYRLLQADQVDPDLYSQWQVAEEAIYTQPSDAMVNWDSEDLVQLLIQAGWIVHSQMQSFTTPLQVTSTLLRRWFSPGEARPSYRDHLSHGLAASQLQTVQQLLTRHLLNQVIPWQSTLVLLRASPSQRSGRETGRP
jgi:putative ATPase